MSNGEQFPAAPDQITVRDYFAGQALALVAGVATASGTTDDAAIATRAFELADALMHQRAATSPPPEVPMSHDPPRP